jgi:hypothetical protein
MKPTFAGVWHEPCRARDALPSRSPTLTHRITPPLRAAPRHQHHTGQDQAHATRRRVGVTVQPMAGFARATAPASPSPAAALLTGERLVVFLFAARVALAAPVHLAAALAVLVAAALAVELAVDGSGSAPLRRFRTRCGRAGCAPPLSLSSGAVPLPYRRPIGSGIFGIRFRADPGIVWVSYWCGVNWSEAPQQRLGPGV